MVGNHQTSIFKWLFGVPGKNHIKITCETPKRLLYIDPNGTKTYDIDISNATDTDVVPAGIHGEDCNILAHMDGSVLWLSM